MRHIDTIKPGHGLFVFFKKKKKMPQRGLKYDNIT